jgi:hypothetical protein
LERRPVSRVRAWHEWADCAGLGTAWENEQQAGEFADAYKKVEAQRGGPFAVNLRIHRDGKHVTIVQSSDPSFLQLWESSHQARQSS